MKGKIVKEIKKLYQKIAPYIVQLIPCKEIDDKSYQLASGTGFITGDGFLITNYHVLVNVLNNINYSLAVRFHDFKDRYCIFNRNDLENMMTGKFSAEDHNDYIILDLNKSIHLSSKNKSYEGCHSKCPFLEEKICLEFDKIDAVEIGQSVCFFGYPFGKDNLAINTGFISSIYKSNGVNVFQIDGNVNNGNSGGPLFNLDTGKVIGIITRKEDASSDTFKDLEQTMSENIDIIEAEKEKDLPSLAKNIFSLHLPGYIAILEIIEQLKRSVNVGIGYAFEIDNIIDDLNKLRDKTST